MPDPFMSLLAGALVTASSLLLFWPMRGLFRRWQRARQITKRVRSLSDGYENFIAKSEILQVMCQEL
jgi:hypothetical protein